MEKISSKAKNCTLVAIQEATRKSDAEVLAAFRELGYVDHRGMSSYKWPKAAVLLGHEIEEIQVFHQKLTLNQFRKKYSKGLFLVSVRGHAVVVRDGNLIDHNNKFSSGPQRRVYFAHQVLNPPVTSDRYTNFLEVSFRKCPRRNGAARDRYLAAVEYLRNNKNVTPDELLANTVYRKGDLRYDMERGNLVFRKETT